MLDLKDKLGQQEQKEIKVTRVMMDYENQKRYKRPKIMSR